MKKYIISALLAVFGVAGIASAALVDFTELSSYGDLTGITSIDKSNIASDYIDIAGGIGVSDGFTIVGEAVTGVNPSDTYTYNITITNTDDDTFVFMLVAYDGNVLLGDGAVLAPNESGTMTIDVTGWSDYNVGVRVSDEVDMFTARLSDYTVVPEPVTLSTLALGGLAMLRRRKA